MSDLHILAVVPDSNAAVKFRHIANYNPEVKFDCVTVRAEANTQVFNDWTESVHHLCLTDRWFDGSPDVEEVPNLPGLEYEHAVTSQPISMVGQYMHYTPHLPDLCEVFVEMLSVWGHGEYDAMVLWNDRCWYNEFAKQWAQERTLPVVYCERTVFPGMFIVDGTGLDSGHSDLARYQGVRAPNVDAYESWESAMTLCGVEQQRPTTVAQVCEVVRQDGIPTVFVPLQMPYDTNMVFRTGGDVIGNRSLLSWVHKHRQGQRVLVKKHPGDWFTIDEELEALCSDLGFTLCDFAIHPLLECVDEVVTINSQVALEAYMHDVPVTFLGQPSFVLEGLTGRETLQVLRWGYYVEPAGFGKRVAEIIKRGPTQ
jgi:hypothetical protein